MNQNIDEKIALHRRWWKRENGEPVVVMYAPCDVPCGGMDVEVPVERIAERKQANGRAMDVVRSDALPIALVDYGTAFVPALGGAGFECDGHTSWAIPCASCAAELRVKPFDAEHVLWRDYERKLRAIVEGDDGESYVPAMCSVLGPMDVLSCLLGPENLAMALYAEPEEVKRAAGEAAELSMAVIDANLRILKDGRKRGGVADWLATWFDGTGVAMSEDFSALVSEAHYREFFMEADARVFERYEHAMLHLHSGALSCLAGVLDTQGLKAMELSNDPNGPELDRLIEAGRKVQERGLPVQMSNWEKPLTMEQVDRLIGSMDVRGLKVSLQARSVDEAEMLYAHAKEHGARSRA